MGLTPIILCGGAGSRLWPISREEHPKPFITMADGQSLLQKALQNAAQLITNDYLVVVTNQELFFKLRDQAPPSLNCRALLEPVGRNTAPAIAAAALDVVDIYGPEQIIMVLAADHLLSGGFSRQVLEQACPLAEEGWIVTFGIKPTRPETGYGYIETSGKQVVRFVEKPDDASAAQYLAAGNFLWNSGMFCFKAGVIIEQFKQHCPQVLQAVEEALSSSLRKHWLGMDTISLEAEAFASAQDISIDYAIMEKTDKLRCLAADFAWDDIGSFASLSALRPSDAAGNQVLGQAVLVDVQNTCISSQGRLVAGLGLNNLLIVDTPDALLVADKNSAQRVKDVYNQLKRQNHPAHKRHRRVARPWGAYTVLEEGPGYKIKRVEVNPKASLSLQRHSQRSEHWVVVAGQALVTKEHEEFIIEINQSTYIGAGCTHRLANPQAVPLIIIEVQSGAYLGEDDIQRFDDQYQRLG